MDNQFARLFGIIPLGIGLTTIGFLWGTPFGGFGSPPLFFRIFGSFVALGFVFVGAGILFGNPSNRPFQSVGGRREEDPGATGEHPQGDSAYTCAHCGAPLAEGADVSPHGDVKCPFCKGWFNVHGK
jgi:hypothetical protein